MVFSGLGAVVIDVGCCCVVSENAVEAGYSLFLRQTDTRGVMIANRMNSKMNEWNCLYNRYNEGMWGTTGTKGA